MTVWRWLLDHAKRFRPSIFLFGGCRIFKLLSEAARTLLPKGEFQFLWLTI
jgi:hypothetical protein